MSVPFYLQRLNNDKSEYHPDRLLNTWNTAENPDEYKSSLVVSNDSWDKADLQYLAARNMEHIANAQPAPSSQRPSAWKDNIDYTKGYNSDIEDKFRSNHDYLGLADYLSHFRMGNLQDQRAYENEISQLRRYGRQYNAIHSKANTEQSNAISFLESFNDGNVDGIDPNNTFKQQYSEAISGLGRNVVKNIYGGIEGFGNKDASTITVSFNDKHVRYGLWGLGADWMYPDDEDEDQFVKFAQETGYDASTIMNMLGENAVSTIEGKTVINVPKSNIKGIKFLTQVRDWCNKNGRTVDDVQYASYGPDNNLINDNTLDIGLQIQGVSSLLDRANKSKADVERAIGAGKNIVSTTVLPYMNERQMQLKQYVDNGIIDDAKYTSMLKADNEIYENLLLAADFSQLDIYTTANNDNPGDRTLRKMEDNLERGALKDYINNAMSEDRVSWRAGISGGEYGTYLEINAVDEKGKIITDKDDSRRGMTIFIPGLFTESIQQAFNASTQGKTVAEFNSMQMYGYEYSLSNGNVISNVGNYGARLYDKNTNTYRDITREEAQTMLHQDIIIEDASKNIRNRAFNLDGTRRAGYDPTVDAKKIAIAAVNELYPSRPVEELDVAAWNPSKEDAAMRKASGDIDKDFKSQQAYAIYSQLMSNIYKLLNINNR